MSDQIKEISNLDDLNNAAEMVMDSIKAEYGDNILLARTIIAHAHHQVEMSMKAEVYRASRGPR